METVKYEPQFPEAPAMRLPRVRFMVTVSSLAELILAVAMALACARTCLDLAESHPEMMIGAALTGVALVEGGRVWFDAARRRGPSPMGFGRATWSMAAGISLTYVTFWGL